MIIRKKNFKPKSPSKPQSQTQPAYISPGGKCWVTIKFEGKDDTLTIVTDSCKIDIDKRVSGNKVENSYFVIHGFLADSNVELPKSTKETIQEETPEKVTIKEPKAIEIAEDTNDNCGYAEEDDDEIIFGK